MFNCFFFKLIWKNSVVKVWQSHFEEMIELITLIITLWLSVCLTSMQFFQIEKLQQSKLKKSLLLLNITTSVKFILFSSTCSVQLICHIFNFIILGFRSLILDKLKKHQAIVWKENDNNWSFLVAYSPSIM